MIARSAGLPLLLVVLAGCGVHRVDLYACTDPDIGHRGPDGEPDECHERDMVSGGPPCDADQVVHWWLGWDSPTWLWIGPEAQAPECPRGSATLSYEGHADLVAPSVCEACTCEPPTGSCALPSTLTASTTACSMPGGASTSFNAPTSWDGSCDSTTQTPSGAAHSLTIEPIAMTENGCAAGPPSAAKVVALSWDTYARACDVGWVDGPTERSICLPADPPPPGFALCIYKEGERPCPTDSGNIFTERHVFYQGVEDQRQCSACTCGAPMGSACTAMLSVYKGTDFTCNGTALTQTTISSSGPTCIDVQLPGQSLGSKSAESMTYLPGTCPAMGGDGSGNAIPTNPATLCCRP